MVLVIKIKAIIIKDRRKKVFTLAFGSSGTDQSAYRGGTMEGLQVTSLTAQLPTLMSY